MTAAPDLRLLGADDAADLETFLLPHRDASMFLRSNAQRAGLVFGGQPLQGTYVAAIDGGRIAGVAAHYWNGMLLVQAPDHAAALARACVEQSGRSVTGLGGPLSQVHHVRAALDLLARPARADGDEWLYALDLIDLVVPAELTSGAVTCRPPAAGECEMLHEWRMAYDVESLGARDTPEQRASVRAYLDAQLADRNVWVAVADGRPVSLSAFNAALPDIVQLGGIYTPPDLRRRGFARAAVAGSLLAARARGVSRAVLFTPNPHAAAAYEAVGFRRTGDYGIVLFA
jgi:GNAT superfamily N-acetyltransferase